MSPVRKASYQQPLEKPTVTPSQSIFQPRCEAGEGIDRILNMVTTGGLSGIEKEKNTVDPSLLFPSLNSGISGSRFPLTFRRHLSRADLYCHPKEIESPSHVLIPRESNTTRRCFFDPDELMKLSDVCVRSPTPAVTGRRRDSFEFKDYKRIPLHFVFQPGFPEAGM